jgi:hypothetical protein
MADCSVFLELDQAQLDVITRVLGSACPVVQLTARHQTDPVLLYGVFPHHHGGVHPLYAVPLPDKPGQVGIHLTESQKEELQRAGVEPCEYIEVEPIGLKYGVVIGPVVKYGAPVVKYGAPVVKYGMPVPPPDASKK